MSGHLHRRESALGLGFLAKLHPSVVKNEVLPLLLQLLTPGEPASNAPLPSVSCLSAVCSYSKLWWWD